MNSVVDEHRRFGMGLIGLVFVCMLVIASGKVGLPNDDRGPEEWPLRIAVIGDQFTAGKQNEQVWPTLMAQRTGWSVSNFALPDTGFIADGRGGHSFAHQLDRAQAADPRIILIVCGPADTRFYDTAPISVRALDAINRIQLSGERAMVIGPTWFESPVPDAFRRVSEAARQVAEEAGVPFLDALNPPCLSEELMLPEMTGPNDAGQSVIADKIAAWLRTEVAE